jgi:hypothetical protein
MCRVSSLIGLFANNKKAAAKFDQLRKASEFWKQFPAK